MSCNLNSEEFDKSGNNSIDDLLNNETELKIAVLNNGDSTAYSDLCTAYLDHSFQEEVVVYSIVMANKYDYTQAYFDVFNYLTSLYSDDFTKIDEKTSELAVEYLLNAKNKGHHQAIEMLEGITISDYANNKSLVERIFE
jgi:hypothetical protein